MVVLVDVEDESPKLEVLPMLILIDELRADIVGVANLGLEQKVLKCEDVVKSCSTKQASFILGEIGSDTIWWLCTECLGYSCCDICR